MRVATIFWTMDDVPYRFLCGNRPNGLNCYNWLKAVAATHSTADVWRYLPSYTTFDLRLSWSPYPNGHRNGGAVVRSSASRCLSQNKIYLKVNSFLLLATEACKAAVQLSKWTLSLSDRVIWVVQRSVFEPSSPSSAGSNIESLILCSSCP